MIECKVMQSPDLPKFEFEVNRVDDSRSSVLN